MFEIVFSSQLGQHSVFWIFANQSESGKKKVSQLCLFLLLFVSLSIFWFKSYLNDLEFFWLQVIESLTLWHQQEDVYVSLTKNTGDWCRISSKS